MSNLIDLPPELLSRIVSYVATPPPPDPKRRDPSRYEGQHVSDRPTYTGLSYSNISLATSPAPDLASLRSLRLVSKIFSELTAVMIFAVVRVLPTEKSAERYTKILEAKRLNGYVRKVVFQTRKRPHRHGYYYSYDCDKSDDYDQPHPFFLAAMLKAAKFRNLTHAELVFVTQCGTRHGPDRGPENEDFRTSVLETFYAGLADAKKLFNLSIKSLQNITPKALMGKAFNTEEIAFKKNFETVMKRITQLGLGIATEDWDHAPEHTLQQPEVHNFFGFELQEYWVGPIAAQLEYLKIYGNEEAY